MTRRIFFLIVCLVASSAIHTQPLKVQTQGKAALLYNPKNGAILFQKRAFEPHYPASTMKLASLLYILDGLHPDLDQPCAVNPQVIEVVNASIRQADLLRYPPYVLEHDGVSIHLKEGDTYTLRTLLYAMLLHSANDAANVVAEHCSGSIENFMKGLNQYLKKKGIAHTQFQNPHGLYHPAQWTTPLDMAKVMALCLENPVLSKMLNEAYYEPEDPNELKIKNWLTFVHPGKFFYPKIRGGKTGYTKSSGFNLVAAAEFEGRQLIAVLYGYERGDDRFVDAIRLFETAFREQPMVRRVFSKGYDRFTHKLYAKGPVLQARLNEDVYFNYFPSEEQQWEAELSWELPNRPIKEGDQVGFLLLKTQEGHLLTQAPLYATKSVAYSSSLAFWIGISCCLMLVFLIIFFLSKKRKRNEIFP